MQLLYLDSSCIIVRNARKSKKKSSAAVFFFGFLHKQKNSGLGTYTKANKMNFLLLTEKD